MDREMFSRTSRDRSSGCSPQVCRTPHMSGPKNVLEKDIRILNTSFIYVYNYMYTHTKKVQKLSVYLVPKSIARVSFCKQLKYTII